MMKLFHIISFSSIELQARLALFQHSTGPDIRIVDAL